MNEKKADYFRKRCGILFQNQVDFPIKKWNTISDT